MWSVILMKVRNVEFETAVSISNDEWWRYAS